MNEYISFDPISSRTYQGDLIIIIGLWAVTVKNCHRGKNIFLGGAMKWV
jgi:hypothetical protein